MPKLINTIKELWSMELSTDYLKKLSDSMPGRLKMVINAKWGHDKVLKKLLALVFSRK